MEETDIAKTKIDPREVFHNPPTFFSVLTNVKRRRPLVICGLAARTNKDGDHAHVKKLKRVSTNSKDRQPVAHLPGLNPSSACAGL